jgi:hypothetical protein
MKPTEDELRGRAPLTFDTRLQSVLQFLLTGANQRQIWLFFLDEGDRLIEPIMPMNDHPCDPYALEQVEDLGLVSAPELFVHRAQDISQMIGAASFVIVWERLGGEKYTSDDLAWAEAFAEHACAHPQRARLRALFLLHDRGIRQIAPNDYA